MIFHRMGCEAHGSSANVASLAKCSVFHLRSKCSVELQGFMGCVLLSLVLHFQVVELAGLGRARREHPANPNPRCPFGLLLLTLLRTTAVIYECNVRPWKLPACCTLARLSLFQLGQAFLARTQRRDCGVSHTPAHFRAQVVSRRSPAGRAFLQMLTEGQLQASSQCKRVAHKPHPLSIVF